MLGRRASAGSGEKTPPVQREDVKSGFSGSLDLDVPRRGHSMEFPTLTEEKPRPVQDFDSPPASSFNPRRTGVPSGAYAPLAPPVSEYPAYVSPYRDGAAQNSFIQEPSFPDDSFVDETAAYRPEAETGSMPSDPGGYYGEDGQWYPYAPGSAPQGYYGEDGQWYSYPNPYSSGSPSYPDYSYPDNSSPDLSESRDPTPKKPRRR